MTSPASFDLALVGLESITSPMFSFVHRALDRQRAGVFHGVEEDRRDLAADARRRR
jgi:hypothetical protein